MVSERPESANPARPLLSRVLLGQPLWTWVAVTVLCGAVAGVLARQVALYLGWQKAIWLCVEVTPSDFTSLPPPLAVSTRSGGVRQPLKWENQGEYCFLGIDPGEDCPIIHRVEADGRTIPLEGLILPQGWALTGAAPKSLEVRGRGLLGVPGRHQELSLAVAAGNHPGILTAHAFENEATIDLSDAAAPSCAWKIRLPPTWRAWVLLSPEPVEHVEIALPPGELGGRIESIRLFGSPAQEWTGERLESLTRLPAAQPGPMEAGSQPSERVLRLPVDPAVNRVGWAAWLVLWGGIGAAGLAALVLLRLASRLLAAFDRRYEVVEHQQGWAVHWANQWLTLPRGLLLVGTIAFVYHAGYALAVRPIHTPDSVEYYFQAAKIAHWGQFSSLCPGRTPGYPLFIASTLWGFGDQLRGVVLMQHLALACLGPVAFAFLYRRTNPVVAVLGGMAAGLCPIISISANIIWTESLFAVVGTVAVILLVLWRDRPGLLFLVGVLIGLYTLIRPNGMVLLGIALGWLFCRLWWAQPSPRDWRRSLAAGSLLTAGYAALIVPWCAYFAKQTGVWGMTYYTTVGFAPWAYLWVQNQPPATLAIHQPVRLFLQYPSVRPPVQHDPWTFFANIKRAGIFVEGEWEAPRCFCTETWRETLRTAPADYRRLTLASLRYNFTFQVPANRPYLYFDELTGMAGLLRTEPIVIPTAGGPAWTSCQLTPEVQYASVWETLDQEMHRLALRESLRQPRIAWWFLKTSTCALRGWFCLSCVVLASALILAGFSRLRHLLPLWGFWLMMIVTSSVMGMPCERYVAVIEPVAYLLAACVLYGMCCCRLRRVATPAAIENLV